MHDKLVTRSTGGNQQVAVRRAAEAALSVMKKEGLGVLCSCKDRKKKGRQVVPARKMSEDSEG
jgi:hypothetical protein